MGRFYIQDNDCGGYEVRDRRDGNRVVSHSSFYEFCAKAQSRLSGTGGWSLTEAFRYYGVSPQPPVTEGAES